MSRSDIAVIVIGRNEGERLDRCLRSTAGWRTLYVDSGSSDGSAERARAAGAEVIELDPGDGFSAARGRNAGLDRVATEPALAYLQMLDGDCTLDPDWIASGAVALDADPALGAVFGALSEREPDASIYTWLLDVEWAAAAGPARVFGGNVMLRAQAVRATGGFRPAMIAGEDPEYAARMRAAGWQIMRLPEPMATHEASLLRFGQWWRRSMRAGHAFAELTSLHPDAALHDFARSRCRILFWAGIVPIAALTGLLLSALLLDHRWLAFPAAMLLLVSAQIARITLRERHQYGMARALVLALFLAIGKYPEMIGLIRFHIDKSRNRRPKLIEYKAS